MVKNIERLQVLESEPHLHSLFGRCAQAQALSSTSVAFRAPYGSLWTQSEIPSALLGILNERPRTHPIQKQSQGEFFEFSALLPTKQLFCGQLSLPKTCVFVHSNERLSPQVLDMVASVVKNPTMIRMTLSCGGQSLGVRSSTLEGNSRKNSRGGFQEKL